VTPEWPGIWCQGASQTTVWQVPPEAGPAPLTAHASQAGRDDDSRGLAAVGWRSLRPSAGLRPILPAEGQVIFVFVLAYDPTGRLLSISRGASTLTSYTYNPDGSAASRTDNGVATSTFTYTTLGQLASASLPGSTGASFTWALDGSLAARTWGQPQVAPVISGTYVGMITSSGPTAITSTGPTLD
jgi:YD repeat-containing protein